MRNPIRIEEARAAQGILYSLARACTWLRGISGRRADVRWTRLRQATLLASVGLCLPFLACSDREQIDARAVERVRPGAVEAESGAAPASDSPETPVVVFLGTSLTAGYGLEEDQAFPALIQERIHEASLDYRVINAGVSGDTSAGGRRRLDWLLRLPISVLVLELGANDMLRGQGVDQLKANLDSILEMTAAAHPNARFVVAGMRAAPNLGREYGDAFDAVYPELARRHKAALVPFLLQDVAARRSLNQADGIHPTAEGHALIAERVWRTLEPVLR